MTLIDLLRALLRRWVVVTIGVACTALAGLLAVRNDGVYWTRTEVIFLAPASERYPNSLKTRSEDIIITAGLVAKRVVGAERVRKYASPDVNLIGIPDDHGDFWIRLPDSGGQWAPHFADQLLLVEAMGPTMDSVRTAQAAAIQRIETELHQMQRQTDAAPVNDIQVKVAPESTVIYLIRGSKPRALGMTAALGGALTLSAVVLLEMRARRRSEPEQEGVQDEADGRADAN